MISPCAFSTDAPHASRLAAGRRAVAIGVGGYHQDAEIERAALGAARGLDSISINVRITAVRKLAVEAADNGLLAPEPAKGIQRGAFSFCSPLRYNDFPWAGGAQ